MPSFFDIWRAILPTVKFFNKEGNFSSLVVWLKLGSDDGAFVGGQQLRNRCSVVCADF